MPGIAVGVVVIHTINLAWLDIVVGILLLAGLALTRLRTDQYPGREGGIDAAGGFLAGFMNALVGMAGPILVMNSRLTGWEHRRFAASLQPIFLILNISSVIAKVLPGLPAGAALPPWWVIPVVITAVLAGARLAGVFAARIPAAKAHALATFIAVTGCIGLVIKGVTALI